MSKINVDFRENWNKNFPEIPCWVDPTDPKKEFRPIKQLYELQKPELPFLKWVKYMGYQNFVLDFCLVDYKLAVEIDGSQHRRPETIAKDRRKSNLLQILGWSVLRYDALTVLNSPEVVYEQILECLLANFNVPKEVESKYSDY